MRSINLAIDQAIEAVKELVDSNMDLSSLCKKHEWGIYQINRNGNSTLNTSKFITPLKKMARGELNRESALKMIVTMYEDAPELFDGIDMSSIYKARNFFYSTPDMSVETYNRLWQEAYAFASGLFGYDISGEYPVPLASPPNGMAVIYRLSDALDLPESYIADKFKKASSDRKMAMRAVDLATGFRCGEGPLVWPTDESHYSDQESTQSCG